MWARELRGIVLLAAGCREELGPETMQVTHVSGVVRVGEPARRRRLDRVHPDRRDGRQHAHGPPDADGSFEATRVAVGTNLIGLAHPPITLPGGRLFETFHSPIRRDIPAGPSSRLSLDLLAEFYREQKARGPRH
jgi:hypothetical protein